MIIALILLVTFLLSVLLCGLMRSFALRRQWLDRPVARSSHSQPTPHGGGAALYGAFGTGAVAAHLACGWFGGDYAVLFGLGGMLVALGVLDDVFDLPVSWRLGCYAACCLAAAYLLLWPAPGGQPAWLAAAAVGVVALALLWAVNLYNFMDGIDGIAALQCIAACAAAALLSALAGSPPQYVFGLLMLAAAQLGFLLWNASPARLFMGDAGSIPTGFLLGSMALLGATRGYLSLGCWLILLAPFIVDGTWTLLRRAARGEQLTQPHRQHAYQRLSRRWGSHLHVDMLLLAIIALWLFPLASALLWVPKAGILLVILAYIPLLAGMAKVSRFA
jgi:Fuc2NAc and GlcNAc transferase